MSPLGVALTVLGILLLVMAVSVVIWLPIVKKLQRMGPELERDLAASGEAIVRAPERGSYRGATSVYGVVKGLGLAALTEKRLVFRKVVGKDVVVQRAEIASVRVAKWFMGGRAGGQEHVILKMTSGAEVGFFFVDRAAWVVALSPRA